MTSADPKPAIAHQTTVTKIADQASLGEKVAQVNQAAQAERVVWAFLAPWVDRAAQADWEEQDAPAGQEE